MQLISVLFWFKPAVEQGNPSVSKAARLQTQRNSGTRAQLVLILEKKSFSELPQEEL